MSPVELSAVSVPIISTVSSGRPQGTRSEGNTIIACSEAGRRSGPAVVGPGRKPSLCGAACAMKLTCQLPLSRRDGCASPRCPPETPTLTEGYQSTSLSRTAIHNRSWICSFPAFHLNLSRRLEVVDENSFLQFHLLRQRLGHWHSLQSKSISREMRVLMWYWLAMSALRWTKSSPRLHKGI